MRLRESYPTRRLAISKRLGSNLYRDVRTVNRVNFRQAHLGRAVLAAISIGLEVGCKLGPAFGAGHCIKGWHCAATAGVLGSAGAKKLYAMADRCGQLTNIAELTRATVPVESRQTTAQNTTAIV